MGSRSGQSILRIGFTSKAAAKSQRGLGLVELLLALLLLMTMISASRAFFVNANQQLLKQDRLYWKR